MSRLLIIGDSNIYRNVNPSVLAKKVNRPASVLHATRQQTLEVAVKSVTAECELLFVSALSNILCDEYGQEVPDDRKLSTSIQSYVDLIATAPSASTLLLAPFLRSEPTWFASRVPKMRTLLVKHASKHKHVTVLPEFKVIQLDLLKDGVHLGADSGSKLLAFVASCILDLQNMEPQQSEQPVSEEQEGPETISDVMKLLRKEVLPLLGDVPANKTKVTVLMSCVLF